MTARKKPKPTPPPKPTGNETAAVPVPVTAPDIDALSAIASDAERKAGAGDPATPEGGDTTASETGKAKRGRPKKVAPPVFDIPADLARVVIQAPYQIAAARYGNHWLLSDREADSMVGAHIKVAIKYMPKQILENSELATVVMLHLMALGARTILHQEILRQMKEKPPDAEPDQPDSGKNRFGQILPAE